MVLRNVCYTLKMIYLFPSVRVCGSGLLQPGDEAPRLVGRPGQRLLREGDGVQKVRDQGDRRHRRLERQRGGQVQQARQQPRCQVRVPGQKKLISLYMNLTSFCFFQEKVHRACCEVYPAVQF
jgi:hypothetical protein